MWFELLGAGGFGSLNYEYRFQRSLAIHGGVGLIFGADTGYALSFLHLSWLPRLGQSLSLEFGAGPGVGLQTGSGDEASIEFLSVKAGVRIQPDEGGLILRAGLGGAVSPKESLVLPGISIGWAF